MDKQERILRKASEVSYFCMELSKQDPKRCDTIPWADFAYGEALIAWEDQGKDPRAFFSTKGDDPFFVAFREDLTKKFKLEVLTEAEGEARKRREPIYKIKNVDGFPN
jgi:hypothetical protein